MTAMYDLHVHLDFVDDPASFAEGLRAQGVAGAFSCTVTPADYERAADALKNCDGIRVGLGLHPWWIADDKVDEQGLELFETLASRCLSIGEVGLDRTKRAVASFDRQLLFLKRCLAACRNSGTLFSFHSSHAADALLDVLETVSLPDECSIILHWFNGSSTDLTRAIRFGCYFSLNQRMLATKRGRAYAQAIPESRLLLETDGPSERLHLTTPEALAEDLGAALQTLESLRHQSLGEILATTSERLLKLP